MGANMSGGAAVRWRELIDAQERSGLGVAEFADQHGLNPATLYWWRSRLQRAERSAARIVPIEIVGRDVRAAVGTGKHFEIELAGGRRLRIPPGFDAAELARLIRALERAC